LLLPCPTALFLLVVLDFQLDEFLICVGCMAVGAAEQVLGALLYHPQVVLRSADRGR
jgi:hypothetical protein